MAWGIRRISRSDQPPCIGGYAENGNWKDALSCSRRMGKGKGRKKALSVCSFCSRKPGLLPLDLLFYRNLRIPDNPHADSIYLIQNRQSLYMLHTFSSSLGFSSLSQSCILSGHSVAQNSALFHFANSSPCTQIRFSNETAPLCSRIALRGSP